MLEGFPVNRKLESSTSTSDFPLPSFLPIIRVDWSKIFLRARPRAFMQSHKFAHVRNRGRRNDGSRTHTVCRPLARGQIIFFITHVFRWLERKFKLYVLPLIVNWPIKSHPLRMLSCPPDTIARNYNPVNRATAL